MKRCHEMPFGAALRPDGGGTRFRVWAPAQPTVALRLHDGPDASQDRPMTREPGGWHALSVADAGAGTRYRFVMPDGLAVPDPASRFNPDDVHGASEVIDPAAYDWRDGDWRGRPWHEAVVYELHIGTFTDAGTFDAAIERLPALARLGVTAVELMPVADFPGRRGWGYDGVLMYAPEAAYGRPEAMKRFVDAAHALGLMVLLDVVYNHFGPEGNYLHGWCPGFFDPGRQTPWGDAIRFDGPASGPVRDFYRHNALYWIEEFHLDGLRLDAVHAIRDRSDEHLCRAIARALHDGPGRGRHVHLVLENDDNDAALLARDRRQRAPGAADAQWNDDFHHAAHVLATGERDGYYADHADDPVARLGRTLAEGFSYQGEPAPARGGAARGRPSAAWPPTAFVAFLQNHDQVGNRAHGERLDRLAAPARVEALLACLLLAPHVPMLFMGEEFAASTPFLYFCDFDGELARAVREGRRAEFGRFAAFTEPAARHRIPDPNAPQTFDASRLRWDERECAPHARRLALVQRLLHLRQRWLTPRLEGIERGGHAVVDGGLLQVRWTLGDASAWRLAVNLGPAAVALASTGQTIYARRADAARLHPDGVLVSLGADGA